MANENERLFPEIGLSEHERERMCVWRSGIDNAANGTSLDWDFFF